MLFNHPEIVEEEAFLVKGIITKGLVLGSNMHLDYIRIRMASMIDRMGIADSKNQLEIIFPEILIDAVDAFGLAEQIIMSDEFIAIIHDLNESYNKITTNELMEYQTSGNKSDSIMEVTTDDDIEYKNNEDYARLKDCSFEQFLFALQEYNSAQ